MEIDGTRQIHAPRRRTADFGGRECLARRDIGQYGFAGNRRTLYIQAHLAAPKGCRGALGGAPGQTRDRGEHKPPRRYASTRVAKARTLRVRHNDSPDYADSTWPVLHAPNDEGKHLFTRNSSGRVASPYGLDRPCDDRRGHTERLTCSSIAATRQSQTGAPNLKRGLAPGNTANFPACPATFTGRHQSQGFRRLRRERAAMVASRPARKVRNHVLIAPLSI